MCLALYPRAELAADVRPGFAAERGGFSAVTLGHVTRRREDVDAILERAAEAGGAIEKPAQDVFWGGYSGYFSDPDGHLWEVAHSDAWRFHPDGRLIID